MDKAKYIRVIGALGLTMMSSCFYDPYYYGASPYHHPHGTYYPYDYYYYPSVQVYFQYSTGFYFYISDGIWTRSRVLPPHFLLNSRDRVPLWIKSDKPYQQNLQHVEKYRPRPDIKQTPGKDRYERETLRKAHKEQLYYKQKKEFEEKKEKSDKNIRRR